MSSIIHVLDEATRNKIAAGEVVERPASCIKELVENAIDAGASSVEVEIADGGQSYMRVTDDGCGMSAEDAKKCIIRHGTSKISSVEDIFSITSLGFRGEACPASLPCRTCKSRPVRKGMTLQPTSSSTAASLRRKTKPELRWGRRWR